MELQPVQSSNLSHAGYLAECQVLFLRYKDGKLYARPGVDAETAQQFWAAKSKGSFAHGLNAPAIEISAGTGVAKAAILPAPVAMLQSYQEDKCCGRGLRNFTQTPDAAAAGKWTCPKCGTDWTSRMEGAIRHWSPTVPVLLMRRGL